jgi:hypothetical protein
MRYSEARPPKLVEAGREGETEYCTVAVRYSLKDETVDRTSGRVIEGGADEGVEVWTFMRARRQLDRLGGAADRLTLAHFNRAFQDNAVAGKKNLGHLSCALTRGSCTTMDSEPTFVVGWNLWGSDINGEG